MLLLQAVIWYVRVCGMFLCLTCADSVDICVPCHCASWSGSGPTGRCHVLSDYSINSDNTVSDALRLVHRVHTRVYVRTSAVMCMHN